MFSLQLSFVIVTGRLMGHRKKVKNNLAFSRIFAIFADELRTERNQYKPNNKNDYEKNIIITIADAPARRGKR
jgi:hypothetical protein